FEFISGTFATNGTIAAPLPTTLTRLFRWKVTKSGTYSSDLGTSHVGTLTIREAGGGNIWSQIELTGTLGKGRSQIACYTVPKGFTLYLDSFDFSIATTKSVNVLVWKRENANVAVAPFGALEIVREYDGLTNGNNFIFDKPLIFTECTDIIITAQ